MAHAPRGPSRGVPHGAAGFRAREGCQAWPGVGCDPLGSGDGPGPWKPTPPRPAGRGWPSSTDVWAPGSVPAQAPLAGGAEGLSGQPGGCKSHGRRCPSLAALQLRGLVPIFALLPTSRVADLPAP